MKTALITGITGQDGSYLTELLLNSGHKVYGVVRRASTINTDRIDHIYGNPNLKLVYGDLADSSGISKLICDLKPDYCYNTAAQSHVKVSFDIPEYTVDIDALGTLRILEAIKNYSPNTKFVTCSSSEMFGASCPPQNELTPFKPRSPYACAKVYSYYQTINYREAYNLFASNSICFNHESPRRGETFVTRKITLAASRIKYELQDKLYLGNLNAKRDWGHSKDYCVDIDVPILTTKGWCFYNDINIGDAVINFNTEKNCLSTDIVLDKVKLSYMKNKYVFSGGGFFLRCSENHKIIYQSKTSLSKGSWSKYKITTAKEFFNLINSVNTPYVYRLAHFANYDKKDNETISDNELYLIGVIASKGYLSAQTFDKGAVLSISQSKITNDKIHLKIINILNSMNLTYSVQNRNDGVTEWKFNSESTIKLLSLFDNENIHTLPNLIYTLSSRQANILFNALMDCDGCWGTSLYSSKRYLLVVQLQTIAAIAGYRTKQIKYTKNKTNKVYTICSITKSKQHQYIQSAIIEQQTEESEIWCITTKNNTIITRDNDCISISGNSSAIIKIAEYEKPDDFVIATGEMHSIKEFAEKAFDLVGLDPYKYIIIDPKYYRPAEVDALCGDADKAKKMLGWEPKISFDEIIKEMVDYDLETARKEHLLNNFSNSAQ